MDVHAVSASAGVLQQHSSDMREIRGRCAAAVHVIVREWKGPDSVQFSRDWNRAATSLHGVERALRRLSNQLDTQVHRQSHTSGVATGTAAGGSEWSASAPSAEPVSGGSSGGGGADRSASASIATGATTGAVAGSAAAVVQGEYVEARIAQPEGRVGTWGDGFAAASGPPEPVELRGAVSWARVEPTLVGAYVGTGSEGYLTGTYQPALPPAEPGEVHNYIASPTGLTGTYQPAVTAFLVGRGIGLGDEPRWLLG